MGKRAVGNRVTEEKAEISLVLKTKFHSSLTQKFLKTNDYPIM